MPYEHFKTLFIRRRIQCHFRHRCLWAKVTTTGLVFSSLKDGKEFNRSYKSNKPIYFPLTAVISRWNEGVQLM